jgi:hypothetical protein
MQMFHEEVQAVNLSAVLKDLENKGYSTPNVAPCKFGVTGMGEAEATHYLVTAFKTPVQEAKSLIEQASNELKNEASKLAGAAAGVARGFAARLEDLASKIK